MILNLFSIELDTGSEQKEKAQSDSNIAGFEQAN